MLLMLTLFVPACDRPSTEPVLAAGPCSERSALATISTRSACGSPSTASGPRLSATGDALAGDVEATASG